LLGTYIDSLQPYDDLIGHSNPVFTTIKIKELVVLLLQLQPELKNLLFDFSEPGKLDLEAFMNQNFHFNVPLERFAYLTGRSLSTFKRDFEKIYSSKPGKWLQQRRLREAYYLIKEKGLPPIDVYMEVGFQDLSHFSYAFKKEYGLSPTKLL
jgi:AraC-like DNA-binding protein